MLAQDRPKSHGMTTVFKDYGTNLTDCNNLLISSDLYEKHVRVAHRQFEEQQYLQ